MSVTSDPCSVRSPSPLPSRPQSPLLVEPDHSLGTPDLAIDSMDVDEIPVDQVSPNDDEMVNTVSSDTDVDSDSGSEYGKKKKAKAKGKPPTHKNPLIKLKSGLSHLEKSPFIGPNKVISVIDLTGYTTVRRYTQSCVSMLTFYYPSEHPRTRRHLRRQSMSSITCLSICEVSSLYPAIRLQNPCIPRGDARGERNTRGEVPCKPHVKSDCL